MSIIYHNTCTRIYLYFKKKKRNDRNEFIPLLFLIEYRIQSLPDKSATSYRESVRLLCAFTSTNNSFVKVARLYLCRSRNEYCLLHTATCVLSLACRYNYFAEGSKLMHVSCHDIGIRYYFILIK